MEQMENDDVQQIMQENYEVQEEMQRLFNDLVGDVQSFLASSNGSFQHPSPNKHSQNSEEEKARFIQTKTKFMLEIFHSKYQQRLLQIARSQCVKLQESLKNSNLKVAELQANKDQVSNKLVCKVKELLLSDKDKQAILLQVSREFNLEDERQDEYNSWKKAVAEHRKIYSNYSTVRDQHLPFAGEDVVKFFQQVDNLFDFGVGDQIQSLRAIQQKVKEGQQYQGLIASLKDTNISNSEKLTSLYRRGYLSTNPSNVSEDLLQLVSINRVDQMMQLYNQMLGQRETQLRLNYARELRVLEQHLQKTISASLSWFRQFQACVYSTIFKVQRNVPLVQIGTAEQLDGYFKNELVFFQGNIKDRIQKHNNKKTYLRLAPI